MLGREGPSFHPHYTLSVPSSYTYNTTALYFIHAIILYVVYKHKNYQRAIIRPPSQTKCNHPSSLSSPPVSASLDFIFLPVLSITPRFTLISGVKGPRPGWWLLHRCGLVWSITPPRQLDGIAEAHRMTDPEPRGQPGSCLDLFDPSSSIHSPVRCDPQPDMSEPWWRSYILGILSSRALGNINISILNLKRALRWLHGVHLMFGLTRWEQLPLRRLILAHSLFSSSTSQPP